MAMPAQELWISCYGFDIVCICMHMYLYTDGEERECEEERGRRKGGREREEKRREEKRRGLIVDIAHAAFQASGFGWYYIY